MLREHNARNLRGVIWVLCGLFGLASDGSSGLVMVVV
jgi:hypothetical protein